MNLFDEYAAWTDSVAKYPPTAEPFYLALGIADESGELSDANPGIDRLKEGGDVLWYCARYAVRVLGVNFSSVVADSSSGQLVRNATKHIGIICGVEKKRIRDGHMWDHAVRGKKTEAAYAALVSVINWVRWELDAAGYSIEDAINANMGKLKARLEAGTIQGDGDNR